MMFDGTIFAIGTPEEVITEENLKTVYGVTSVVITDEGRPHVILRDTAPVKEADSEAIVNTTKLIGSESEAAWNSE